MRATGNNCRGVLLGVLISAPFFSARAEAVLNAAIATKFDAAPAYQGCPVIGSGSSLPPPAFCKELKTAETYCAYFTASPSLQNDKTVEAAGNACKEFYQAAIDYHHLLCDYVNDASSLQGTISQSAKAVDSNKSADAAAAHGARCAQKIYGYYREAAIAQNEKLAGQLSRYQKAVVPVTKEGATNLLAEVHCQKNGAGDAPPSILLLGLSSQSLNDAKETQENISQTTTKLSALLLQQFAAAGSQADNITQRKDALGAVDTNGIAPGAPGKDKVGTKSEKILRPVVVSATTTIAPLLMAGLEAGAEGVQQAFLPVVGYKAIKSLVTEYLSYGEMSKVGLLSTIGSVGIGVTGAYLGAPVAVTVTIGIGYRYVVATLRAAWNAYDNEVALAYRKFWQENFKSLASATSGAAGQAYASRKQAMAYCSQCGPVDAAANCPGAYAHAHGYNDNYVNNSPGFINPWVKKVWDEKNPGYHMLMRIPPVHPTSTAP